MQSTEKEFPMASSFSESRFSESAVQETDGTDGCRGSSVVGGAGSVGAAVAPEGFSEVSDDAAGALAQPASIGSNSAAIIRIGKRNFMIGTS